MLLYLSVFTIAISVVLFYYNWKSNKNIIYLSSVFILSSLFGLGHYFMALSDSRFWLAVFYNHFSPLMFLIGPFLYFYIRNTLKVRFTLSKKDWIHFVPALIALIGTIPYSVQPFEKKLAIADQIIRDLDTFKTIDVNLFYDMGQSFALRCVIAFIYLIYCISLLLKYKPKPQNNKQSLIVYRWLIVLLTCLFVLCSNFIILTLNALYLGPSKTIEEGYVLYFLSGLVYSIMSFSLLFFPEILYGIPNKATAKKEEKEKNTSVKNPLFDESTAIKKYLLEKKPFLNPEFNISHIAIDLTIPQNQVSYCINVVMGTKFSKLKTELRIKHAIELLEKGTNSSLTIEAIGKQSGFKTRSNFYAGFKEITGITPSEYLEKVSK